MRDVALRPPPAAPARVGDHQQHPGPGEAGGTLGGVDDGDLAHGQLGEERRHPHPRGLRPRLADQRLDLGGAGEHLAEGAVAQPLQQVAAERGELAGDGLRVAPQDLGHLLQPGCRVGQLAGVPSVAQPRDVRTGPGLLRPFGVAREVGAHVEVDLGTRLGAGAVVEELAERVDVVGGQQVSSLEQEVRDVEVVVGQVVVVVEPGRGHPAPGAGHDLVHHRSHVGPLLLDLTRGARPGRGGLDGGRASPEPPAHTAHQTIEIGHQQLSGRGIRRVGRVGPRHPRRGATRTSPGRAALGLVA